MQTNFCFAETQISVERFKQISLNGKWKNTKNICKMNEQTWHVIIRVNRITHAHCTSISLFALFLSSFNFLCCDTLNFQFIFILTAYLASMHMRSKNTQLTLHCNTFEFYNTIQRSGMRNKRNLQIKISLNRTLSIFSNDRYTKKKEIKLFSAVISQLKNKYWNFFFILCNV